MIRISKNPGWYQALYKSYGCAPNARELYDIAHKKMEDEVYYNLDKADTEGMDEKETMEAAKKRVESLERVKDIVDKFDDKDIVAQSLLEPETYEQVYTPTVETLSQGNAAVKKSARDSALILSKMAENFHKNYGVPLKMAAVKIAQGNSETLGERFFSPANRDVNPDYELNVVDITKYIPSEPISKKGLRDYVKKYLYNQMNQRTNDGKAIIKVPESAKRQNHIADSSLYRVLNNPRMKDLKERHDRSILDITDLIRNSILVESQPNFKSNKKSNTARYHNFYVPIKVGNDLYAVRITAEEDKSNLGKAPMELELYDVIINKKADSRTSHRMGILADSLPSKITIRDLLRNVKDAHGQPFINPDGSLSQGINFYRNVNGSYNQMAGERANTAMISCLLKAESMEREAVSSKEIFGKTGWMRGPDHKWRFEIPDNLDKIDFPKDGKTHTLGEIYDNPDLYEAYPELAQKTVRMEDTKSGKDKRTRGAYGYVAEDGSIVIDSSLQADEAKTALVHEIQHSIQAIEGFSRGGNKEMAKKYISDTIDRLSMDLMDMELKDPKAKEYMDMAEEIANSFDENDVRGSLAKVKKLTEKRKALLESLPEGERKELSTIERDISLLEDAMKQDDYAAYRRLGGEAEAFMAEGRARNPSKSMPDYNTPYGPAVINYAGESLPFRMEEPDLVALHNLTVENLKKAIDLGGLAVPSVAITKKQTPYNFGSNDGVTLIMDKNVVDPAKTPVFSRDAYTKVFPSIVRTGDRRKITKFIEDAILPAQKEIPREVVDYGNLYTPSYPANHNEKNGELQEDVESFLHSDGAKYLYLKSIGKAPKLKMKKRGIPEELSKEPKLVKALESLEKEYGSLDKLDEKGKERLSRVLKETYAEKLKAKGIRFHRLIESAMKRIESGDRAREVIYEFKKRNDMIPDKDSFISDLNKRAKGKPFESWKESFRNEMLGESIIRDTGKPANLENITAAMIGGLKNAQKNMFSGYGIGNIIAASGKKLKSLDEFHKAEKNLNPEADIEDGMSKSKEFLDLKSEVESFVNAITPAYKWEGSYNAISEAYGVLVDYVKGKKLSSALAAHDFTEPPEAETIAKRIKEKVKDLPAKYFEAKPQRAVYFNEVKGAILPKNTPKEIKDYLRTQGVKVRLYDPKVEGQREEVTNKLQNQVNQYFQGEKYLGAYDRDTNAIEIFNGANQSTVIHEGAHMYLSMLEEYANLSPEEMARYFDGDEAKATSSLQKIASDLKTIREWAAYTEGHLKEYEGTALEKEFKKYGEDIENGVEGAEERFMQERFARGFEKYLMEGSAPTKELKGVFRRFKSWLKDIYSAAKNLGNVKLTPEIKDIYDHMLATDREVEAWAAQRKLDSIDKALNVNASEAENLKK
ncbi:LPD23 domain-containing protein [uncultured Dialister sp.]|uniref:LPD23 domain-containing protein n=1 Tax=uncultured Dialister sp. TaxID=278064 RepID=UPI002610FFEF|nr:LPD23 domain-containing protein [uncultured Dialister sp.]